MLCYKDMTFCAVPCGHTNCKRNKCHVPDKTELPVSWADFSADCDMYIATCVGREHDKDKCTAESHLDCQ